MVRILLFIDWLLGLYTFVLVASAILSWLIAFDVVNLRNNFVRAVAQGLEAITEPVIRPFRQFIPPVGGLDLSILAVFIIIEFLRMVIIPQLIESASGF